MADSTSHSVFISLQRAAPSRKAHNQSQQQTCKPLQKISWLRSHIPPAYDPPWQAAGLRASSPWLVFPAWVDTVCRMNKTVIEVQVRAVLPTSGGCAVFIGNNDKVFIIYVDQTVGSAITMFMREISKERPLTHDLMGHLMTALGAKVERVII